MPAYPLLGNYPFTVISAAPNALIIDGPLFTADKKNLNGWGIPESESDAAASSFVGMPVRWCPKGKLTIDPDTGEVVGGEHYCDLINSQTAIKGTIIDVYRAGTDNDGRPIYNQKARITDPATIQGIMDGTIPHNVSMWAYGIQGPDDMIRGVQGLSESIVTVPAYPEAAYTWQAIAAALKRSGVIMGASGAYVPNNPKGYGKSTGSWSTPSLKDFTSKSWDDLTEQEKNAIRSCFAAVTDDTFGGCKLPHHNPNGTVVKAGVDNAMARLGQTQGLGSVKSDVEAHLRSHQKNDFKEDKGAAMATEAETKQIALDGTPIAASASPAVVINLNGNEKVQTPVSAAKEDGGSDGASPDGHNAICGACGAKYPKGATFCPACGTSLHPQCAGCGSTAIPVGAKFCPSCGADLTPSPATGTTGDNTGYASKSAGKNMSIPELVAQELAAAKDLDTRKTLAASIAQVQTDVGILQVADVSKTTEDLVKLPASVLETQLAQLKMMAAKVFAGTETGLTSQSIAAPMVKFGAGLLPRMEHGMPPQKMLDAILSRFSATVNGNQQKMTMDHILKYGSLQNVRGVPNWKGEWHKGREVLPI